MISFELLSEPVGLARELGHGYAASATSIIEAFDSVMHQVNSYLCVETSLSEKLELWPRSAGSLRARPKLSKFCQPAPSGFNNNYLLDICNGASRAYSSSRGNPCSVGLRFTSRLAVRVLEEVGQPPPNRISMTYLRRLRGASANGSHADHYVHDASSHTGFFGVLHESYCWAAYPCIGQCTILIPCPRLRCHRRREQHEHGHQSILCKAKVYCQDV